MLHRLVEAHPELPDAQTGAPEEILRTVVAAKPICSTPRWPWWQPA
ncbi:MAG: hypothetical protein ACYDHU_10890 [Acidimicrobiales bacterium]